MTSVGELPDLPVEFRVTFQGSLCTSALLPRGARLYRYGSTAAKALSSTQEWVYLTRDRYHTSDEVIQNLCLLDVTGGDLGEFDPKTGAKLAPIHVAPRWKPSGGEPPQPWNVAAFRSEFEVIEGVRAWVGLAGPMAFDLVTGKRYTGGRNSTPHLSRPGGGSQVLVHRTHMHALSPRGQVIPLARVKYLT